jgi:hypothetical protein
MIHREPDFLGVVRLGSSPAPSPITELDWLHTGRLRKRDNFLTVTGEGGEGMATGEQPYHTIAKSLGL